MPFALYALTAGAFGIGVTEFVVMGLLLEVGAEFGVSIQAAGWLISGYALGVVVGAPLLTAMTMLGSLIVLAAVLGLMTFALHSRVLAVIFVGLLGASASAFATVAPLQMWVLDKAQGAGQSLASSFNIAAFNLGNAVGAWLGGIVIAHGPGLGAITWVAALLPLGALGVALAALRLERGQRHLDQGRPLPEPT